MWEGGDFQLCVISVDHHEHRGRSRKVTDKDLRGYDTGSFWRRNVK